MEQKFMRSPPHKFKCKKVTVEQKVSRTNMSEAKMGGDPKMSVQRGLGRTKMFCFLLCQFLFHLFVPPLPFCT